MEASELIGRLEAASEGSRELDGEVLWLVDRPRALRAYWNAAFGMPKELPEDFRPSGLGLQGIIAAAPTFTTSLDAIVALIERKLPGEAGWAWGTSDNPMIVERFNAEAWVRCYDARRDNTRWEARSSTAPLALCIALLRALQHQGEAERG